MIMRFQSIETVELEGLSRRSFAKPTHLLLERLVQRPARGIRVRKSEKQKGNKQAEKDLRRARVLQNAPASCGGAPDFQLEDNLL